MRKEKKEEEKPVEEAETEETAEAETEQAAPTESEGKDRFGRELHKVTCSECGRETEVPFKPDGTRPVYCRDCYQKHRKPRRNY